MAVVGNIAIAAGVKVDRFNKGISHMRSEVSSLAKDMESKTGGNLFARAFGGVDDLKLAALGATASAAAAAVAGAGVVAVKSALDFEQLQASTRKASIIFGDQAKEIEKFASKVATSYGISEKATRDAASAFGGAMKNAGADPSKAVQAGIQLTDIGMNLAAFAGKDASEAFGAIGAALRGEYDPLEQFNIGLKAGQVEAKALELGLAKTKTEVTDFAKKMATIALISEQSKDAMGSLNAASGTLGTEFNKTGVIFGKLFTTIGSYAEGPIVSATRRFNELAASVLGYEQAAHESGILSVEEKAAAQEKSLQDLMKQAAAETKSAMAIPQELAKKRAEDEKARVREGSRSLQSSLQDQIGTLRSGSEEAWNLEKMAISGVSQAQITLLGNLMKTKVGLEMNAAAAEKAAEKQKEFNAFNREHWGVTASAEAGSAGAAEAVARFMSGPPPQQKEQDRVQQEQLNKLSSIDSAMQRAAQILAEQVKPKTASIGKV